MKNVEEYDYFSSIDDETSITHREIIEIIYKINLNKIFEINKIINKALQQLTCIIFKQIRFLFDKCIKKKIQSLYFKKIITIMLRKSKKKLCKIFVL